MWEFLAQIPGKYGEKAKITKKWFESAPGN
jgi:hypothetical protein